MKVDKFVTLCCPKEIESLFVGCTSLGDYIRVGESLSEEYVYCVRFTDRFGTSASIKDMAKNVPQGVDIVEYCNLNYPKIIQEAILFVFRKDDYRLYRTAETVEVEGVQPSVWATGWAKGKPLTLEESITLRSLYHELCKPLPAETPVEETKEQEKK